MKLVLDLSSAQIARLNAVAGKREVSPEALAAAYIEDWLNIEYAELLGRGSWRGLYRDGPIAFDAEAAASAALVEKDVLEIESRGRPSH